LTGRLRQTLAAAVATAIAWPMTAHAAPVLRSADIRIVIDAGNTCVVTMTLAVDGGGALDHRIEAQDETRIHLSSVRGARQLQEPRTVGRTRSLLLDTAPTEYELTYSVQRPPAHERCPLWVPAAPADGVSRAVRISVELPPGSSSRGTMPAFRWNGAMATTTLGHIPAFVRVSYGATGDSTKWDVATAMDAFAILVFAAASGIWVSRRRLR
jgi:hypothetical protein